MEQIPRIHFEYTTLEADNKYPDFEVHVVKGQQVGERTSELISKQFSSYRVSDIMRWCDFAPNCIQSNLC